MDGSVFFILRQVFCGDLWKQMVLRFLDGAVYE